MFVSIITDCFDSATFSRQLVKYASFFNCPLIPVAIDDGLDEIGQIQAAGCLIDVLESSEGPGIVIVNSAPRNTEKFPNGTPFGFCWWQERLIISAIDGETLSFLHKYDLVSDFVILDIPTVANFLLQQGLIDEILADKLLHTQFRSLEFLPRAANFLWQKIELPGQKISLNELFEDKEQKTKKTENISQSQIQNAEKIWLVDNFGNLKTGFFVVDIDFQAGKKYEIQVHRHFRNQQFWQGLNTEKNEKIEEIVKFTVTAYQSFKDVPKDELALIVGSSGFSPNKMLELVVNGHSASQKLKLKIGDLLTVTKQNS